MRAAEAAGSITVVLTDKTGTLTENRLRIAEVEGDRGAVVHAAWAAHGILDAVDDRDPIQRALGAELATRGAPSDQVVARFAFDPQRKRESALWQEADQLRLYVKGAPEGLLAACELPESERAAALARVEAMAERGRRVIAVAHRQLLDREHGPAEAERDLRFLGLIGFEDPLRPGVPDAVRTLRRAGVRTIVVSGDHPAIVAAVAAEADLPPPGMLVGGAPLAALDDGELTRRLRGSVAVARATPADKLRLVRLLQADGEVVAVTGDGVNDALALSGADVGIAMGQRGTDLARQAADLVLTDDAYPTVAVAIAGGRGVGAQLRRAVAFYLGAKVALVAAVGVPLAAGLPSPFEPVHIVLLELFMDIGASIAFVGEPPAPALMQSPPRDSRRAFLDRAELSAIAVTAVALVAAVLPAYLLVRPLIGSEGASAAALVAWLAAHAAIAWTLRARPRLPFAANPAFPAWAALATLTALALALTPLGTQLGLTRLSAETLAIALLAATVGASLAAFGRRALSLNYRL